MLVEGFEKGELRLQGWEEHGLWGHLHDSWVILSFALNINGDPNNDLNFKFVWAVSDASSLECKLVISDDDVSSTFLKQVLKLSELVSLLDLFLVLLLFLFSGSASEVKLDVHLFLDAELVLNGLSQLFDFDWGLELNDSLLSCFLNLRTCVNYLTSILRLQGWLSNLVLVSEGIYDRNFWFIFCRFSLSCRLDTRRSTRPFLRNSNDNRGVILNSCVIKPSGILL